MNRPSLTSLAPSIWLALGLCLFAGCSSAPAPRTITPIKVAYQGDHLVIGLSESVELTRAEARGQKAAANMQPLRWDFTPGARRELDLWPAPSAGAYELRILAQDREPLTFTVEVPAPPKPGLEMKLRLPLDVEPVGTSDTARPPIRLMAGVTVMFSVDLENHSPDAVEFLLEVANHPALQIEPATDASVKGSENIANDWNILQVPCNLPANERTQLRFKLIPDPKETGKTLNFSVRSKLFTEPDFHGFVQPIQIVKPEEMLSDLKILDAPLPVLPGGIPDENKRANTITVSTAWTQTLKRWLGKPDSVEDIPLTHQAIRLANTSENTFAVDVFSEIQDANGRPAPAFQPPSTLMLSDKGFHQTLLLAPKSEQNVVFPVYVQHSALPGTYQRVFQVRPLSFSGPGLEKKEPLILEQTGGWAFGLTLLSVILTFIGGAVALVLAPRILKHFARTEWAQISLFGSATFVLVNAPSQLLAPIIHVFVPVFHPLVLGAYSDTASACVMAALFVVVPRPGVAFLSGSIRFLLNGLTFGAFAPAAFLYAIPMWVWDECVLYGTGVTRGKLSAGRMVLASALIGIGGAVLQTALGITLFRLFYADWYLALFFALNGICYPALGGLLGQRLGLNLRKTAE